MGPKRSPTSDSSSVRDWEDPTPCTKCSTLNDRLLGEATKVNGLMRRIQEQQQEVRGGGWRHQWVWSTCCLLFSLDSGYKHRSIDRFVHRLPSLLSFLEGLCPATKMRWSTKFFGAPKYFGPPKVWSSEKLQSSKILWLAR